MCESELSTLPYRPNTCWSVVVSVYLIGQLCGRQHFLQYQLLVYFLGSQIEAVKSCYSCISYFSDYFPVIKHSCLAAILLTLFMLFIHLCCCQYHFCHFGITLLFLSGLSQPVRALYRFSIIINSELSLWLVRLYAVVDNSESRTSPFFLPIFSLPWCGP